MISPKDLDPSKAWLFWGPANTPKDTGSNSPFHWRVKGSLGKLKKNKKHKLVVNQPHRKKYATVKLDFISPQIFWVNIPKICETTYFVNLSLWHVGYSVVSEIPWATKYHWANHHPEKLVSHHPVLVVFRYICSELKYLDVTLEVSK